MSQIRISNNSARSVTIDIEGVIGVAENLQFDQPEERVATYEKFKDALARIADLKTRRITVNIRSAGGDVNDALLIHDSLCSLGARITTRCYGYIASAATIIAQAASPGRREISSNALYLVHNSVSQAEGNSKELSQTIDLLRQTDNRIAAIYAARSGKPHEEFLALMSENDGNGRWLSPEEALAMGLADRIIAASPLTNAVQTQIQALRLPLPPLPVETSQRRMSIAAKCKKLLSLLGLRETTEVEVNDRLFERIEAGLPEAKAEEIPAPQIQDAKLKAKATRTMRKEDPASGDIVPSANQTAYAQDAKAFL